MLNIANPLLSNALRFSRACPLNIESFERREFVRWQGAGGDAVRAPLGSSPRAGSVVRNAASVQRTKFERFRFVACFQ